MVNSRAFADANHATSQSIISDELCARPSATPQTQSCPLSTSDYQLVAFISSRRTLQAVLLRHLIG
jgi:hypothetical protein